MKILYITNAWPSEHSPVKGIFIKKQVERYAAKYPNDDIEVISVHNRLDYIKLVFNFLKFKKFDVVHCHHVLTGFIVSFSRLINPRSTYICSFLNGKGHNVVGAIKFMSPIFETWVALCFDKIIVKNKSYSKYETKKFQLLPNPVDETNLSLLEKKDARKILDWDQSKKYVLFVSANNLNRPAKRKDIFDAVIKIVSMKIKNIQPIYLSKTLPSEIPIYLRAADLLLVTSDHEGSPNIVKEARLNGLSIVSRNVGDVEDICAGAHDCKIVDSDDVSLLAKYVEEILKNNKSNSGINGDFVFDDAEHLKSIYEN